ncbi:hypothetical protein HK096_001848, partial [Nowakowskiella sp. JEL0078]
AGISKVPEWACITSIVLTSLFGIAAIAVMWIVRTGPNPESGLNVLFEIKKKLHKLVTSDSMAKDAGEKLDDLRSSSHGAKKLLKIDEARMMQRMFYILITLQITAMFMFIGDSFGSLILDRCGYLVSRILMINGIFFLTLVVKIVKGKGN